MDGKKKRNIVTCLCSPHVLITPCDNEKLKRAGIVCGTEIADSKHGVDTGRTRQIHRIAADTVRPGSV